MEEGPPYVYQPPVQVFDGPAAPSAEECVQKGYIRHIRYSFKNLVEIIQISLTKQPPFYRAETPIERSGGYKSVIACHRALQEALQGLFHGS